MNTIQRAEQLLNLGDLNGCLEMLKDVARYDIQDVTTKVYWLARFSLYMDGRAVSEHAEILSDMGDDDGSNLFTKDVDLKTDLYFYSEDLKKVVPVYQHSLQQLINEFKEFYIPKTW